MSLAKIVDNRRNALLSLWRSDSFFQIQVSGVAMLGLRRLSPLTIALICAGAALAGPARANVVFDISYETSSDRARPDPQSDVRTHRHYTVILSRPRGNANARGQVTELSRVGVAGAETVRNGNLNDAMEGGGNRWTTVSATELVRIAEYPQHQVIMTLTTHGESCAVDVRFKLKPGFKEFKVRRISTRDWGFYSRYGLVASSCSARTVD